MHATEDSALHDVDPAGVDALLTVRDAEPCNDISDPKTVTEADPEAKVFEAMRELSVGPANDKLPVRVAFCQMTVTAAP